MGRIRRLPIGDLLIGASPSLYFPNPMSIGTAETIKIIADIAKPSFGGNLPRWKLKHYRPIHEKSKYKHRDYACYPVHPKSNFPRLIILLHFDFHLGSLLSHSTQLLHGPGLLAGDAVCLSNSHAPMFPRSSLAGFAGEDFPIEFIGFFAWDGEAFPV